MATYKDIEPIINDFADRIRLLKTDYKDCPLAKRTEMDFTEIVLTLKDAPTADVHEVKHGHWIEMNSDMGIYRCSQCRETVGGQTGSHFCPNCGAKMFGGIDEE